MNRREFITLFLREDVLVGQLCLRSLSCSPFADFLQRAGFRHTLERACSQSPFFKMWWLFDFTSRSEVARIGGRREVIRSRVIRSRREVARIGGRREVIRSRREVARIGGRREVIRSRREVIRR
jgi:hypothetical protein